jgi:hypothetical protein
MLRTSVTDVTLRLRYVTVCMVVTVLRYVTGFFRTRNT